jgi:predicted molibdopterin-dependent oxidoreductase YjgC
VYCPTGALDDKLAIRAGQADRIVPTTCAYCSLGCQFDLNVKGDISGERVIRVTSHRDPASNSINGLHLCLKGRYGYEFIHHPRRHTTPRVRQYLLDSTPRPKDRGPLVEVDWPTAFKIAARRLREIRDTHGGAQTGVLASGRLLNEENFLLNKFARQILGTPHIDCAAHLSHPSVVEGLMEAVGVPAMTQSLNDLIHHAASLLVIGSNLTEQHPVLGAHVRQAVLRRGVKLIVAHPNFINLDEYAALRLTHHPHTETTLINGLIHLLLAKGWIDPTPDHLAEFDAFPPARVAEITGLAVADLERGAELLALHRPTAVLWSVDLADPGMAQESIHALATLQRLLGNLDCLGGGLNPLRSQNNSQGASDMGCLPAYLPGYQSVTDETARHAFQDAWGVDLPPAPGLAAPEMLAAARAGQIKALYIVGEDILNTTPQAAQIRQGLETCEFVLVQEIMPSETSRYADVILPGVSFAEKTGTFTSTERRVQMVNQTIKPLGGARPDWQIIAELARHVQGDRPPSKAEYSSWMYGNTAQIMREIAALTPIYAGIFHPRLALEQGLCWPFEKKMRKEAFV